MGSRDLWAKELTCRRVGAGGWAGAGRQSEFCRADASRRLDVMKPRARRIALVTIAAACLLVAGVVALNWAAVCDNAEAWWFQLTRKTETFAPQPDSHTMVTGSARLCLLALAVDGKCPVIADSGELEHCSADPWQ